MSHNPMGLHGLLQGKLYLFIYSVNFFRCVMIENISFYCPQLSRNMSSHTSYYKRDAVSETLCLKNLKTMDSVQNNSHIYSFYLRRSRIQISNFQLTIFSGPRQVRFCQLRVSSHKQIPCLARNFDEMTVETNKKRSILYHWFRNVFQHIYLSRGGEIVWIRG
jgi:hypothetical protein